MERKGQAAVGAIIISVVAILVGLALYTGTFAENIGKMTKTSTSVNRTMTLPAVTATSELTMCGQKALSYTLTNATGGGVVPTSNYTVTQSTGTDGYLAAKVTTASQSAFASKSVNVTCTYEPKGYIAESSGRGIVALIAIFMALLIVIAAMPNVRNGVLDFFRK